MAASREHQFFLLVRPVDPWPWRQPFDIVSLPREITVTGETDVEMTLDHDDPAVRCFVESCISRKPVLLMTPHGSVPMVVTNVSPYEDGKPSSLKTIAIGSPWEGNYRYRVHLERGDE